MVKAWEKATAAERKRLKKILGNPNLIQEDVAFARSLVERTGALAACQRRANTLVRQAEKAFQSISDDLVRNHLIAWLNSLVKREK